MKVGVNRRKRHKGRRGHNPFPRREGSRGDERGRQDAGGVGGGTAGGGKAAAAIPAEERGLLDAPLHGGEREKDDRLFRGSGGGCGGQAD